MSEPVFMVVNGEDGSFAVNKVLQLITVYFCLTGNLASILLFTLKGAPAVCTLPLLVEKRAIIAG